MTSDDGRTPDDGLTGAWFAVTAPRYRSGTIGDILPGVCVALGLPGAADPIGIAARHPGLRRAIVLLVDGMGYHQLPVLAPVAPTISAGYRGIDALTTGFPSTTPASLAAITTGAATGEHGIVGFTVRVPGGDRVLNHIRWTDDPPPSVWQPVPTMFARAAAAGIVSHVVSRPQFEGSGLSTAVYRGAGYLGANGIEALADAVVNAVSATAGRALVYAYHPDLDRAGHTDGVGSDEWFARAADVDRLIARLIGRMPSDVVLFVTADHGQVNVPVEGRFDLDADPRLRAGVAVVAGEARVRYLHTRSGAADDVRAAWQAILGDTAIVMSRDEAVETGWYGPVAPPHLDRIGDLVVACVGRNAVVASRTDPGEAALIGMHGSITAAEMEIPLLTFLPGNVGRGR